MTYHLFLLLCLGLLLATPIFAAEPGYLRPDSREAKGMHQLMLIYTNQGGPWESWEGMKPYVAYMDRQADQPRDWFFSDYLFLLFQGAPSGGNYFLGSATMSDWDYFLDQVFAETKGLNALSECVERMGEQLGDPDRTCTVSIMVPYVPLDQLDRPDVKERLTPANPGEDPRMGLYRDYIQTVLDRWEAQPRPHLKLVTFYWMVEGVGDIDDELTQQINEHLNTLGYDFLWIPWFKAPGFDHAQELGFDINIMQPNYAWPPPPPGATLFDEDRITECANLCRQHNLGFEIEVANRTDTNPAARDNYLLYLNHGVPEIDGYMLDTVLGYYQGVRLIDMFYRSDDPGLHQLYTDTYHFVKGTYQRKTLSLIEGAKATLNGKPEPRLTDGLWVTRGERMDRAARVSTPARVDVTLDQPQVIGDVRVHLVENEAAGMFAPSEIRVLTSEDGRRFTPAAQTTLLTLHQAGEGQAGFTLLNFPARLTRHLRVEIASLEGKPCGIDEIVVFPTDHQLWERNPEIEGELAPDTPPGALMRLTDGRTTEGVKFASETTRLTWQLPQQPAYLGRAFVHADWPESAQAPACRVEIGGRSTAWVTLKREDGGWLSVPLPHVTTDDVTFELRGGPEVTWTEFQVQPQESLAIGKPYNIEPTLDVKYPDPDNRKLTDGQITSGLGDKRAVAWNQSDSAILFSFDTAVSPNKLRVHLAGGGWAGLKEPARITVLGSRDGRDWRLLGHDPHPAGHVEHTDPRDVFGWVDIELARQANRFIQVLFRRQPTWLMLSEIQLLQGDLNVAPHCRYYLQPDPLSDTVPGGGGGQLTNGWYRSNLDPHNPNWQELAIWPEGSPTITVDLLHPKLIATVGVHSIGGGQKLGRLDPARPPQQVRVEISADGEQWVDVGSVTPPEKFNRGLLHVTFKPRRARFVRLHLEAPEEGILAFDEVSVFGP